MEMVSREESPKWKNRGAFGESTTSLKECDRLPTWDVLEATLDEKLHGLTDKLTRASTTTTTDRDEHTNADGNKK